MASNVLLILSAREYRTVFGVSAVHLSLSKLVRNEPCTSLPPDLVSVLTTPPAKRPYSAEIPDVDVVVSWIASSMNRLVAWPRRFSLTTTPLTRNRLSYDWAPEIVMALAGPVVDTPAVSVTAP